MNRPNTQHLFSNSEAVSVIAHDLKSPLSTILTSASLLRNQISGELNPDQINKVNLIYKNSEKLLHLIEDILEITQLETGQIKPKFKSYTLRPILVNLIESFEPLCKEKNLKLHFVEENTVPKVVTTDLGKFQQIVTNVVTNSIKYTPKGDIFLSVSRESDKSFLLQIKDTGLGMSKPELDSIFLPYKRSPDEKKFVEKGVGLGLYITRLLIELLGGKIEVESQIHQGTEFKLFFPNDIESK